MPLKNRTKKLLANTLISMMERKRLADIRVGDICEQAEVSRRTFYYHFQDKYDLLAWIVDGEFRSLGPESAFVSEGSRTSAYEALKQKGPFFKMVYSDPGISELAQHLASYDIAFYETLAKEVLRVAELTQEQLFSLKMFVYGGIYTSRDWVLGGFKTDPSKVAQMMSDCMPPWLAEVVRKSRASERDEP